MAAPAAASPRRASPKQSGCSEGLSKSIRSWRERMWAWPMSTSIDWSLASTPADNQAKQREAARNAVRLDPTDGETQLILGYAFAYQGMADQALEQFAKAETLAPNNAHLLILIAWYLPQFGQPDRAVALVEKALRLNPNYPYWYNQGFGTSISLAASSTNP